jgi:hypothetical protein
LCAWSDAGYHRGRSITLHLTIGEADRFFSALVLFEVALFLLFMAVTVFDGTDLSSPGLLQPERQAMLWPWICSIQFLTTGFLLFFLCSHRAAGSLSSSFFAWAALGFILLSASKVAGIRDWLLPMANRAEPLQSFRDDHLWFAINLLLGMAIAVISHRHVRRMWKAFHQETLIILTGIWIFLMGAVGIEILSGHFMFSRIAPLDRMGIALEAFLEMSGASVILYGTLLLTIRYRNGSLSRLSVQGSNRI